MKTFYVLFEDNICHGVYTSLKQLHKGVDYWIKINSNKILHYNEYKANYALEPLSWDWAYIPIETEISRLTAGGGSAPSKKYFGKNIVFGYKKD